MPRCKPWLKGLAIAGLFVAGVIAVAAVMPLFERALGRRAARLNETIVLRWNRAVCRVLNLHLHVVGQPDASAGLLVANHVSWLDIIALGARHRGQFIAKEDVADWPVMGYLARGIGTLFVRRGDAGHTSATAEAMVWRLRQGKRLMLFPEGTTTTGERVLRFHGKLFQPAQRAGVPIQAIALRYEGEARHHAPFIGEDDFLPHLLGMLALERIDLRLHYCPALPVGLPRGELAAAARRQIVEALEAVPDTVSRHFHPPVTAVS